MSSLLVSGQCCTPSAELATRLAESLGFELLDESIYARAAARYGLTASALRDAFEQPPSLFGMSDSKRRRLAVALQATLCTRLCDDSLVYHGPFAPLLVRGIAHIVTLRVAASVESRAAAAGAAGARAGREGRQLAALDGARDRVAEALFGMADLDTQYDEVLDVGALGVPACVERAAAAARADRHRPTSFSRRCLAELASGRHLAALLTAELDTEVDVVVFEGVAKVRAQAQARDKGRILAQARALADGIDGVSRVEVQVVEHELRPAAAGSR
jgi:hypothetical protein